MSKIVIGVDIGGSHITCMGVDPEDHSIREDLQIRQAIDCHATAETILRDWAEALERLIRMPGTGTLAGIGFAMPGPFNYPEGIALFRGVRKYDSLYGINIKKEMQKRLGLPEDMPVRFLNDATCFAIGEAWIGMGSGSRKMVAITLGTGFGSAFIDDGIPVETGTEVPESGCVYHLPYGKSIANDYFSTNWFLERYREVTGLEIPGVREIYEEIRAASAAGREHPASGIFHEFGIALGDFLAPWLLRFGAGCLVIGGNIANSFDLFEVPLKTALANNQAAMPVYVSGLGELAGIAGSARLCDNSFYSRLPFVSGK
jgi:glucokinase